MTFRTRVELGGKTATGMEVPAEIVEALGQGKRPPVRVTIGDYTYRSTVAPYNGVFMLPVSAEVREGAGIAAGDDVEVTLELDTEPREVEVPEDFAAALAEEETAKRAFDALSYSNKRRLVLSVEGAKTEATRTRRIAKAMSELLGE